MVSGGDGGNGLISFRHEKFVPFGGPDGGDGGKGGDVYIVADESVTSLDGFRYRKRFKAAPGKSGGKQRKHGANGSDLFIPVPLGTLVFEKGDTEGTLLLADLSQQGERVLVAKGGSGGLGNARFATASNQAPKVATKGGRGEERHIILEFKIVADVCIVGYPNVGKSSLLAAISRAKPKIADYPFTTREPILGVVDVGVEAFVVAEIPAVIEGAHLGKGLGHQFLRHVERSKVLLHLLDGSSLSIVEDMETLNTELSLYKPALLQKPQIVVVNKVDLFEVQARLLHLKQVFQSLGIKVCFVSAVTGEGIPELLSEMVKMLHEANQEPTVSEMPVAVFRPKPKAKRVK